MWSLAVGPNQQVGIVPTQNATLETMGLDSRRLNDRRVGPPSRVVHDEAVHAVPDFWFPGMPRDPSPMAEQNANTAGFRQAFVVATQCTFHQKAPVLRSLPHVELLCRKSGVTMLVTSTTVECGQELVQCSSRKVSFLPNSRVLWVTRTTSNDAA
jgi:hypothetical protein